MAYRAGNPAKAVMNRTTQRTWRHGNWRQTYVDCGGICQGRIDGGICGNTELLELHEHFGECKNGSENEQAKLQQRVLLCFTCHKDYHEGYAHLNERRYVSKIHEDVAFEIAVAGGYQEWIRKYGLIDRYQPYVLPEIKGVLE